MNHRRRGALAVVLGIAATGLAPAALAHATPAFNGTYTAVENGQSSIWIASSFCTAMACTSHVVNKTGGYDWLFDGTQWLRLALPKTGTCDGATVPALEAKQFLVPQPDGSLRGAVTATVDCGGSTVHQSQPLIVTPS